MGAGVQRWWRVSSFAAECTAWSAQQRGVLAHAIIRAKPAELKPLRVIINAFADLWRRL